MLREISKCVSYLKKGDLLLYPTDTIWGLGCDATNNICVKQLFKLKKRSSDKSMICLMSDIEMLKHYVKNIPPIVFEMINTWDKPLTIIYDTPKKKYIAQNLMAKNGTLAIRIVKDFFCSMLISKFGKPIVSTSANISGKDTPSRFEEISQEILENVAYTVNLFRDKKCNPPSSLIKISDLNEVVIIRP